jgi:hypothetical protein
MLKGALHLHTTVSHDGTMNLAELAEFLKKRGYDFIAVTEHSYDINQASIDKMADEAKALSDDKFLVIPGIEYRCWHNIDILGYGTTTTCDSDNPEIVIEHIKSHGGVAVWAHPTIRKYPVDNNWIKILDGFEIWNNTNDGKFLPQIKPLQTYAKYRSLNPGLKAFCGLDLHRKISYRPIAIAINLPRLETCGIINAMKTGNFMTESQFFNTDSEARIKPLNLGGIYAMRTLLNMARCIKHQLQR